MEYAARTKAVASLTLLGRRAHDYIQPSDADRRGGRRALGRGVALRGGIVKFVFYLFVSFHARVDGVLQPSPWSGQAARAAD